MSILQNIINLRKPLITEYLFIILFVVYSGETFGLSTSIHHQMQDDKDNKKDMVDTMNSKTNEIPEDSLLFVVAVNEKQINAIRKHKSTNYTYDSLEQEFGYPENEHINKSETRESRPLDTGYFKSLEKKTETMEARETNENETTSRKIKEDTDKEVNADTMQASKNIAPTSKAKNIKVPVSTSTMATEQKEVVMTNKTTEEARRTENTTTSNTTPSHKNKTHKKTKTKEVLIPSESSSPGNYFKIQIAASKKLLSLSILKSIYNGNKKITKEKENGWYKYAIGDFDTYQKAFHYTKHVNKKGIFILGYKSGKKYYPYYSGKDKFNASLRIKRNASFNNNDSIMYGVQIAAALNQISDNLLKLLYHGQLTVYESNENNNYKYVVGLTKKLHQAENTLINIDIPGAFIVKYKNGNRIQY